MKEYSTFLKDLKLKSHHQIVLFHIQDTHWRGGAYPSAEMQSMCSMSQVDLAVKYSDHSMNKENFTKGIGNRKHCLQLYLFEKNQ